MLCAMFELGKISNVKRKSSKREHHSTSRDREEKLVSSVISVCGLGARRIFFAYLLDSVLLLDYIIFLK